MTPPVSRDQVINRLREEGWTFNRQAARVDIYRKKGSVERVSVPHRKLLPQAHVRILLSQAGLRQEQVEEFLRQSVKD